MSERGKKYRKKGRMHTLLLKYLLSEATFFFLNLKKKKNHILLEWINR